MTDETSNTGENSPKRGQFIRGDPRINKKGRPRSFDQIRKLAELVAAEQDESGVNRALEILRDWAKSKEVAKQAKFMEYAFGKVPDQIGINGEVLTKVLIEYADTDGKDKAAETPPGAIATETRTPPV
jgi:hypothetical protein